MPPCPPYSPTTRVSEHQQSVKTPSVNHWQTHKTIWQENYLTHRGSECGTTINSPSVDGLHWVVSHSPIEIKSTLSVSVPRSEIKFYLIFWVRRGWSGNPWGWPWASMSISQPFVNHWQATSMTVKYKIFCRIAHRRWASMSVCSFSGDQALHFTLQWGRRILVIVWRHRVDMSKTHWYVENT